MMRYPFPVLLCDIGGTNARFALLRDAGGAPEALPSSRTADFASFEACLRALFLNTGVRPRSCLVCAAGPVDGASVRLTNANWVIDGRALAREFGFEQGVMFNDFEALALSIPVLEPEWLRVIGPNDGRPAGARVIHGPGTGLGTAALIEVEGKWRAVASEGSHSDFAPVQPDELAFWPHVEPKLGRITPEALISGPGLRRLHRARAAAAGRARPDLSDAAIIEAALAAPSGDEADTVRVFWRLAARYAGDVALNFLATGGVFLAGGILPRIVRLLDDAAFRAAFENKAPYVDLARAIPVRLIIRDNVVLDGLAGVARDPDRYAIDIETRVWVG